ncbi:MAG: energy transducer TonB [Bacteroidetes bacterium]|nr:energy transducer TonB [Bacteroidota bacterium]
MDHKKKKKFIKVPEYPGGKVAFVKFIKENMKYPEAALEKGIGGIVHLDINIDDSGNILDVRVTKGIGYGCDEEAVRLALLLKYGSVKNRGLRVKTTKKVRIAFRPEEHRALKYEYKTKKSEKSAEKEMKTGKNDSGTTYGYTISY